jgi:hypothetical protein
VPTPAVSRCGNIPCAEAELFDHLVGAGASVKMRRTRIEHMSAGLPRKPTLLSAVGTAEKCQEETLLHSHSIISSARFRARSWIARCEVRYNREKVLLVEMGYNLGHQWAPFSRSGAVLEVIELPEHVAR